MRVGCPSTPFCCPRCRIPPRPPLAPLTPRQGCLFLCLLAGAWLWAAERRLRCAREQSGPLSGVAEPPLVCLITPVAGLPTPAKLRNLRSQLRCDYPGPVHFLVAVESENEPAVRRSHLPRLARLLTPPQYAALLALAAEVTSPGRSASVTVAGPTQSGSQKIRNQLCAVAAAPAASAYFLFLDDDIFLHPGTLSTLLQSLLSDPRALLATGYPLDCPPPPASLFALCLAAYHLPLLIAFSQGSRTRNVWGG